MLFMSSVLYAPYENKREQDRSTESPAQETRKKHGRNTIAESHEYPYLSFPKSWPWCFLRLINNQACEVDDQCISFSHLQSTERGDGIDTFDNASCHETHDHSNTGWGVLSG